MWITIKIIWSLGVFVKATTFGYRHILGNLSMVCETVEISSETETLEFTGFLFSGEKSEKQLHFVSIASL